MDLFNAIIRICKSIHFKCSLNTEQSPSFSTNPYERVAAKHGPGLHNTISMVFKQATGVPTSAHGYFLEQRIEALTISGKVHTPTANKKHMKQNLIKVTR